jgi:hypothetical protein
MSYEGEEGKLPSFDHGRRTDRGRDKKGNRTFKMLPSFETHHIYLSMCLETDQ